MINLEGSMSNGNTAGWVCQFGLVSDISCRYRDAARWAGHKSCRIRNVLGWAGSIS